MSKLGDYILSEDQLLAIPSLLNEREKKIIIMRINNKTYDYIASLYGLSRERIRQIEIKALRKLRHPFAIEGLKKSLEKRIYKESFKRTIKRQYDIDLT